MLVANMPLSVLMAGGWCFAMCFAHDCDVEPSLEMDPYGAIHVFLSFFGSCKDSTVGSCGFLTYPSWWLD